MLTLHKTREFQVPYTPDASANAACQRDLSNPKLSIQFNQNLFQSCLICSVSGQDMVTDMKNVNHYYTPEIPVAERIIHLWIGQDDTIRLLGLYGINNSKIQIRAKKLFFGKQCGINQKYTVTARVGAREGKRKIAYLKN